MKKDNEQSTIFSTSGKTGTLFRLDDTLISHDEFISWARLAAVEAGFRKKRNGAQYLELSCAFDIETSSFMEADEQRACMWIWMMGIAGRVTVGRTWGEWLDVLCALKASLRLSDSRRIVFYVHNLAYDFQFFRKWVPVTKVFALDRRKPVYVETDWGIDFRCSYILSGYSLDTIGRKHLHKYSVRKLSGDLDYTLIRHANTPVSDAEMAYCVHDVLVVMAYIQEKIERGEHIANMKLTKTSYVRSICRKACLSNSDSDAWGRQRYLKLMANLTLTSETYHLMREAYAGGFTHANAYHAEKVLDSVVSYDFASSYPARIIAEQYPMSAPAIDKHMTRVKYLELINTHAVIARIRFKGIRMTGWECPISESKCWASSGIVVNNGRVSSADELGITLTEVDFQIISKYYEWDAISFGTTLIFKRAYLPAPLVRQTLEMYRLKTGLKGVAGYEAEYLNAKENINSEYGMMVMSVIRDEYPYESDEWQEPRKGDESQIDAYNRSPTRFLYYVWGIYVTAYARQELFRAIHKLGSDYVYSDTDSVKFVNGAKHIPWFDEYNRRWEQKVRLALKAQGFDPEDATPVDPDGNPHLIGAFELDGEYRRFKTLGAKRYMWEEQDGTIGITVAGLGKQSGKTWLQQFANPFDEFRDGMLVPPEWSGRKVHGYGDSEISGTVEDYMGVVGGYHERSFIHLMPSTYEMGLSAQYINYLKGVRDATQFRKHENNPVERCSV